MFPSQTNDKQTMCDIYASLKSLIAWTVAIAFSLASLPYGNISIVSLPLNYGYEKNNFFIFVAVEMENVTT